MSGWELVGGERTSTTSQERQASKKSNKPQAELLSINHYTFGLLDSEEKCVWSNEEDEASD